MFYPEKVFPTYLENWPDALRKLSIPQIDIPLSLGEGRALGSHIWHFKQWFGHPSPIDDIITKIKAALLHFPEGAFVRLGSRSGKDSYYAKKYGLKIVHVDTAIKILTQASERVAFDLRLALQHHYPPHIFVRQWIEIPKWAEFRCFMKQRKLIGISQYDCKNLGYCPEIAVNAAQIELAIKSFFEKFKVASHLHDIVFDVFVIMPTHEISHPWKIKLLEINPFFSKTEAGLFHWHNGGDFDGSFRFFARIG
jgi:hypothetical protein